MTKHPLQLASVSALLTLFGPGCGSSTTSPTTTSAATTTATTTATSATFFSGELVPRASSFYSFNVANAGPVSITLVSVTRGGLPASTPLGLGFGVPSGAGCATTLSLSAGADLSPQISTSAGSGIYCVEVHDLGTLTSAISFVIRIVPATASSIAIGPTTETFSSVLGIHGASSHAFTVTGPGPITAALTSVGPPALTVGLALGVPGAGPPCSLSTSTNGSVGAQIGGTADVGRYCVQVYDLGTVTNPLAFVVTITHP